jgi:hypothetical protein
LRTAPGDGTAAWSVSPERGLETRNVRIADHAETTVPDAVATRSSRRTCLEHVDSRGPRARQTVTARDPKTSAPISSSRTALVGPKQYGDSAATFAVSSPSPSARVCWLDRPQIAWPLQTGPLPVSRPTNLSGLSTSPLRSQAGRGPRQAEQPSCSQAGFRPRKVLIWHKGCPDFTPYPKPDAPCLQRNTVTVGLCRAMRSAHDDVCVRVRID